MGYIILSDPETGEVEQILGDYVGKNKAYQYLGLPYREGDRLISQDELDEIDRLGE